VLTEKGGVCLLRKFSSDHQPYALFPRYVSWPSVFLLVCLRSYDERGLCFAMSSCVYRSSLTRKKCQRRIQYFRTLVLIDPFGPEMFRCSYMSTEHYVRRQTQISKAKTFNPAGGNVLEQRLVANCMCHSLNSFIVSSGSSALSVCHDRIGV